MNSEPKSGGGPPPGDSSAAWILGLAGLLLLGITLFSAPAAADSPPSTTLLTLLALGAVVLDLTAVVLPGFGFFSPSFAACFALALLPAPGPRMAVVAGLAGLVLRTFLRGHEMLYWRVREAVSDLFPLGAGLAALHFVQASGIGSPLTPLETGLPALAAGALAWGVSALLVPGIFVGGLSPENAMACGVVRERLFAQIAGVAAAGVLLAVLALFDPWWALAVLPVLLAVHQGAAVGAFRARVEDRRRLERRLDQARGQLTEAEGKQRKTRQQLDVKLDELALVMDLAETLAGCDRVPEAAVAVVHLARRLAPGQTVALFLDTPEGLVPAAWESPHGELLSSAALLRAREPVVERAWAEGTALRATVEEACSTSLIPDERSRIAIPIPGQGVLYLGDRRTDSYTDQHLQMLGLVAGQAALALQSAARFQSQQEALGLHADAHARLEAWARELDRLLAGLRQVLTCLDPEELLEHLGAVLEDLAPHEVRALLAGDRPGEAPDRYRLEDEGVDSGAVDLLAAAVIRSGLPLLLDDIKGSRFQPPAAGIRSVLAVPMNTEEGALGAIVLADREPGAFGREHQDLAFMLAYQAGAALRSAQLHQELRETHQQLEESQAQLIQSSKMAAVGQLAAGVAHELNTPLGAILLGIDSAIPGIQKRPERAAARLETARKAVLQAREIVSKLLFYSRDARHGFREISVNTVVEDTLELIGHQLREDRVEVESDLGDVPTILANQSEIQQVLTNLALNARDAMVDGDTERHLVFRTRPAGEAAVIQVEDRGPGIDPAVRERIFDPFFTTKPVGRGTGLGLSVSLEIVKRHHGSVEVDSEPGRGTRFTVTLPGLSPEEVTSE